LPERRERPVGGRGEQVGQPDGRIEAELALPVLRLGAAVLAAVRVAKEQPGNLFPAQLRVRDGQEGPPPPGRGQVAWVGAVLPRDDEDPTAHGALVNHGVVCGCNSGAAGASNNGRTAFWSRPRMWIVRLALRRPYTIAVLCSLIAIFGV